MHYQHRQKHVVKRMGRTPRCRRLDRLTPAARQTALDSRLSTLNSRSAFTLVEMLVSVALVVIMMSMFATVFQLAAGSVGTQRGIAENDQRARSVVTVIQNDLKNRSFRVLTPFDADEHNNPGPPAPGDPDFSVRDFAQRVGFFYISENDLNDDTDDVLHFTVELDGTSDDLYFGKATRLFPLSTNSPQTSFLNSNEPDRDDLNLLADSTSDSVAAEIAIFMRGGRLYRRVLLLRDLPSNLTEVQPHDNNIDYFDPANDGDTSVGPPTIPEPYVDIASFYSPATGNFWNDFDFSAHFGLVTGYVDFHSVGDLKYNSGVFPLGIPKYRFGHNQVDGLPREYVGTAGGATNNQFIGRFTHEETSFLYFQYPQAQSQVMPAAATPVLINDGNPMEQNPSSRQLNLVDGIVEDSTGVTFSGPRRAEDLLLSGVHAFDIKVWDEVLQEFVDVGHDREDSMNNPIGDYNANNRLNTNYGPNGPSGNRVFDTWHPASTIDEIDNSTTGTTPGDGIDDRPPFRPVDSATTFPKPLRAIQITIRYFDVSSNQLRQVTQQISLVD